MAKRPTITALGSSFTSTTQMNANFSRIGESFDNTLSRDGSGPNAMQADLDMNSNDILNVGTIAVEDITVDGQSLGVLATAAADAAAFALEAEASADAAALSASQADAAADAAIAVQDTLPEWKGSWVTTTAYDTGDLVRFDGSSYICIVAHTSGVFATDLAASRWELFAQKGAAGAGTGDMVAANNLSDVADAPTALSNIGGQPSNATLTTIASQGNVAAGQIASNAVTTAKILDSNVTTAKIADSAVTLVKIDPAVIVTEAEGIDFNDNDTTIPTSAAVKDYVDNNGADLVPFAQGDVGQPRIHPMAFVQYRGRASLSGTTAASVALDVPPQRLELEFDHSQASTSTGTQLQVRFSENGGSTWTSWTTISNTLNNSGAACQNWGRIYLNLVAGTYYTRNYRTASPFFGTNSGSVAIPAGTIDTMELRFSASPGGATPTGLCDILYLGHGYF